MGYRINFLDEKGRQKMEYIYECEHILDAIYRFYEKFGVYRINTIEEL